MIELILMAVLVATTPATDAEPIGDPQPITTQTRVFSPIAYGGYGFYSARAEAPVVTQTIENVPITRQVVTQPPPVVTQVVEQPPPIVRQIVTQQPPIITEVVENIPVIRQTVTQTIPIAMVPVVSMVRTRTVTIPTPVRTIRAARVSARAIRYSARVSVQAIAAPVCARRSIRTRQRTTTISR